MAKSSAKNSCEALVVGAGPTGLVMANELARHGVKPRIIDKAPAPSDKSKALVLQVRTLEIFEEMGLIDQVLKLGQAIETAHAFMDGQSIARIPFAGLDSPYPFPVMLEQSHTERLLIEALEQKGVQVEREVELTDFSQDENKVTAKLRNSAGKEESVQTPWVLGCDGAHSMVRHVLDLPFHGAEYPETFILADVKLDWDLPNNELHIFFKPEGVMGVFPMHEAKRFRLLGMRETQEEGGGKDPDLKEIGKLVEKFYGKKTKIYDPKWLAKFRLHRRGVPAYQSGRAFVAGDAAHIHSPVGGQGMNTGIQDAYNLGWKLALVVKKLADPKFLESYNAERQPVGHKVLTSTDRAFSVIVSKNPVLKFFRNKIFPHVAPMVSKTAGKYLANFVSELDVNYKGSKIVAEQPGRGEMHLKEGPLAGERAPDGQLAGGKRCFEIFQDPKHVLLIFSGTQKRNVDPIPWEAFIDLVESKYAKVISLYGILSEDPSLKPKINPKKQLKDPDGSAHVKYGAEDGAIYLIRPDGYVGYRAKSWNADDLAGFLKTIFI